MKHSPVIIAVTFLFLHIQGTFIGVSDNYHHEHQRLPPSQSSLTKPQLYSWQGEHLNPTIEKYFPYWYYKILQLKKDNQHSAPIPYTNFPLVYYPPSQHEFQRDVHRKMSEMDNNQWKYVNEKSMDYQSSKLNLGRYERESVIARMPWYTYYPYYYWYKVPYEQKIPQSFINMSNNSQLRSKFQINRSRNYAEYHRRGNDRTPGRGTYLENFNYVHPGGYKHHGDQILEEIRDNHDHSSEILKENENVNYEEVYVNDGQNLENKETLENKDQNKTVVHNLMHKIEKDPVNLLHYIAMLPKDSKGEIEKKPNPEKKQKPQGKNSKRGNDKRVYKGSSIAIKVRHKRSIPTERDDNSEIQPRIFGAIGHMAKGVKKFFFGSSDPETVIMYQGPNGNVQLTEQEFAMLMQQQQNGLQLNPEQFYMKNRVGGGPPVQLTQEQLMMLMQQQQQYGTNMQMQLTPEQIASLMQQQTQQQPGQLTPDQLAVLMQQQQPTGQLSPDQVAALMQQSQSPQQLTPDQMAALMQQQQQQSGQLQTTSSVSTQVSGPYVSYPHTSQRLV